MADTSCHNQKGDAKYSFLQATSGRHKVWLYCVPTYLDHLDGDNNWG
jgi:hypothetical protein